MEKLPEVLSCAKKREYGIRGFQVFSYGGACPRSEATQSIISIGEGSTPKWIRKNNLHLIREFWEEGGKKGGSINTKRKKGT